MMIWSALHGNLQLGKFPGIGVAPSTEHMDFSTIVTARKIAITELEKYKNSLLTLTPEEEVLGYKYVYQTKITKETVHHRIRSSMGMWSVDETYIDNDAALLLKRLHQYYS